MHSRCCVQTAPIVLKHFIPSEGNACHEAVTPHPTLVLGLATTQSMLCLYGFVSSGYFISMEACTM